MPHLPINGIQLFYQDAGASADTGEPLLLIIGWGADHTAWAFQVPAFSSEFRVIAPDNRGAGQTDQPDRPYSISGMAEDMLALLDTLRIERAHLSGASMGGMIAQEIALKHPERVRSLQLHCTLARPDAYGAMLVESLVRVKATGSREEYTRAILPWVLCRKTFADRPEFVRFLIERAVGHPFPTSLEGLKRQAEAIGGHDTLDRLAEIRIPTLITVGAEDILVPPALSRQIHERIPLSELLVLPEAGHLHFMEQFQAFNDACLRFLHAHRVA